MNLYNYSTQVAIGKEHRRPVPWNIIIQVSSVHGIVFRYLLWTLITYSQQILSHRKGYSTALYLSLIHLLRGTQFQCYHYATIQLTNSIGTQM